MPKLAGFLRSPGPCGPDGLLLKKATRKPSSDCFFGMFVFATRLRTSARVAEPFLHALSIALERASSATYVGAPKPSSLPPCDFLNPVNALLLKLIGKNET